ncbi:MAG: DUF4139 domain-containing protein [Bacteroidetes bacterium]|nr:DUF4139 domain-containing protein [Bacteroidota bacterium]MBK8145459.1 DUF4139 domain-containing protein [Bacteroidota bacterium]
MKQTILLGLTLMFIKVEAKITINNSAVTNVTIYRNYAKETRMGATTLPQGNSEIIVSNITQAIDENSIQVGCKNNVKILSVSSRLNYITDENGMNPGTIKIWQDSVKWMDKKSRYLSKQKEAFEVELAVLNANNKLGSNTEGLKPLQLKELLELNRMKQIEIKKLIFEVDEDYAEIRNQIAHLQNQINESSQNALGKPIREIILRVYSKNEVNTQFKISYLVTAAHWTPTYEIRCENTATPLLLHCRAKIVQTTGFDWKNVNIKLSTANPNQNHNRPILYPIYVDFMQPDFYNNQLRGQQLGGYKNMMNEKAPAPAGLVQMMSAENRNNQLDTEEFVDGMKIDANQITILEGEMMVEYEIEQAQVIESDGQEHIIAIQELLLPANYNYHSVPKLDNGVFLLARVTDWGKYNLLAGDATLFFDDMYIGKSYINPNVSSDTLLISLGRDEKLNIKRVKLNDLCVTKKFSNKKKETKAYETIVKNNKNIPVEIEVLDQYPISKNNDIEVTLEEADGAQITRDYGKLLWRIKMLPGESKKIRMVYSVKFPEEKAIVEKGT